MCVPETNVVYASASGTSVATCGHSDPCSIQRAFVVADAVRKTIKLAPGVYTANLVVSNKSVAVRGQGATISATTGDTVTINDTGSLELSGAVLTNGASTSSAVIACKSLNSIDAPQLSLSDAQVEGTHFGLSLARCVANLSHVSIQTTGGSTSLIVVDKSIVNITQSAIRGDGTAAALIISTDNSIVRLTNSSVTGTATNESAQVVAAGGCIFLAFSTVINATATSVLSPAVCAGPTANGVCIENSILANFLPSAPASTVTGAGSIAGYSLAFPQAASLAGPGNKNTNPMLLSPSTGDYHLKAGSPAVDAADPAATQMIDYSGNARPQGAGRDMGAFEYP